MNQTCGLCGRTGHNRRTCAGLTSSLPKRHYPVVTATNRRRTSSSLFAAAVGIPDIVDDTEDLRDDNNYDTVFDLYDDMVRFDPELNGAVRSISLTANNWSIDYDAAKNDSIRNAIRELIEETLDFDDILINLVRNLMVHGNDINKLVGKAGLGFTEVQSLPLNRITIIDERNPPFSADKDNPVMEANFYLLREGGRDPQVFAADEVWHSRIDYRSNWFRDKKLRWTYGMWGASRFTSLKQPIRAKYNSINNRTALEDSLTKQFVTIDKSAVDHIVDPDEQRERLVHIMDEVAALLEGLRGDQVPIVPHYVEMHHVDLKNTIPDNTGFLDNVNADIAAVLNVPRVAAGQERGSTFAATFNANMWSVNAIRRLQGVCSESIRDLFSRHLSLLGIPHKRNQLPLLNFRPIDEEDDLNKMRRATMGFEAGLLTMNQALEILTLPPMAGEEGEERRQPGSPNMGDLPRPNEMENDKPTDKDEDDDPQ